MDEAPKHHGYMKEPSIKTVWIELRGVQIKS